MNFDITRKDVTGSTNDDVWELANAGAQPGVVVRALQQVSGRGRWRNRAWVSPEGGLYFSVLLRPSLPADQLPNISPRFAQAAARVVRNETGAAEDEVWVKHPNDVKCAAGKLCGMSLDAKDGLVVLGVGLNVFHPATDIVTDGRNVAAYVCDLGTAHTRNDALSKSIDAPELRVAYLDTIMEKLLASIATELQAIESESR